MIINSSNDKIKLIVDKTDLEKANISLKEWTSNPRKTSFFIEKLLNQKLEINTYNFKKFEIFTYDFKIYYIEIKLE